MNRLENWFDDVQFVGIAVDDRNIEKAEKIADIFVMPDVVEDVQTRSDSRFDRELLLDSTNSDREELFRQQRQRSHLENSLGRKFSAEQLLSQSQSQKVVLLGAPGGGKTTRISFLTTSYNRLRMTKLRNLSTTGTTAANETKKERNGAKIA